MTLFSSYRLIGVKEIIRSNIRSDQIDRDLPSLINALKPLMTMAISQVPDGSSLNPSIVSKIKSKDMTVDLLEFFGYTCNNRGDFIFNSAKSNRENEKRENGVREFQQFYSELRDAQNGSLNGFEQFIRNANRHSSTNESVDDDEEETEELLPLRKTQSTPIMSSVPAQLPDQNKIKERNNQTLQTIELLKNTLVTKYGTPPSSFIRRKIAILLLQQKNPDSNNANDGIIDQTIDQKIRSLKQQDQSTDGIRTDEIYIECLIRSGFNENKALKLLHDKRPNLAPRIEQPAPKRPDTISFGTLVDPLKQHWDLLKQSNNKNNTAQQSSRQDDKWENAKHLVPALIQFRQKYNKQTADELDIAESKMYRLLYSELSFVIGQQMIVQIEILASVLCSEEIPSDSIAKLNIAAIKNSLSTNTKSGLSDDFRTNMINFLSLTCPICADSYPRNQMETMYLCTHMCCLGCIKDYYRETIKSIRDLQSLNKLTCFQEAHPIKEDVEMNFFQDLEIKIKRWFADEPDIIKTYEENIFHAKRDAQIKKCGNSKCVSVFYIDNDDDEISCVRCPHCHYAQCRQCTQKWFPEHVDMECEEYVEWLYDNDTDNPDVQALFSISETSIMCPNKECQAVYDYKAGGCEHFTCPACKTEFCRMCSTLFYDSKKNKICPQANCLQKDTLHAHCTLNCFRETRIAEINTINQLLNDTDVNVQEALQQKPIATNQKCPVEDCGKTTSTICEHRLCEVCYKQFLCSLIWRNQIGPWTLYEDVNLRQMLVKASIPVPANATRQNLIDLAQQHLDQFLGKPKRIARPRS